MFQNRLWRKTRVRIVIPETGAICWGVDPNRNFGHMWRPGTNVHEWNSYGVRLFL